MTYILLPAVILIWGFIFYKIFFAVKGDDEISPAKEFAIHQQGSNSLDTFSIAADYRDPFVVKHVSVTSSQPKTAAQPAVKKPEPLAAKPWPQVGYTGMIRSHKTNVPIAMLQLNGQTYTVKAGEAFEEIQVIRILRDSVELKFGKEKRFIKK
jgi:Tfp pilus assembly protein PilP